MSHVRAFQLPRLILVVFACLFGLGSCIRMVAVQPEPPSPLKGTTSIAIAFDYNDLVVEGTPKDQWIKTKTEKDPEYPKTWKDLTAGLESNFVRGFRGRWTSLTLVPEGQAVPTDGAVLVVSVRALDMGHYIPFATTKTKVDTVLNWSVAGAIAHQNDKSADFKPSLRTPSVFQHLKVVGEELGEAAGRFLRSKA